MAKILGSIWFSGPQGLIGIVVTNNGYEEKAYIGIGIGAIQQEDEQTIASHGAKFPLKQAKELI